MNGTKVGHHEHLQVIDMTPTGKLAIDRENPPSNDEAGQTYGGTLVAIIRGDKKLISLGVLG